MHNACALWLSRLAMIVNDGEYKYCNPVIRNSLKLVFPALIFAIVVMHYSLRAAGIGLPLISLSSAATAIDLSWHAPNSTAINSLSSAINATGAYNFIFNSSTNPAGVPYGDYNYCNMPHVRRQEYVKAPAGFEIQYVEVIHRHHKRTPYLSNTFPVEAYGWDCSNSNLFYYAGSPNGYSPAQTYWEVFRDASNPFNPGGFPGNCEFPQITKGGLDDSYQHGKDLYGVYHDLLGLIPNNAGNLVSGSSANAVPNQPVVFRVTNNVITSQVASMVTGAMFGPEARFPVLIQLSAIDSLEPAYSCSGASSLFGSYGVNSGAPNWTLHLTTAAPLYTQLDSVSGISPSNGGWHMSFDHYFDSLSSRLCHQKPLPCNVTNPSLCITQDEANEVFRLGLYEYSFIYRDSPLSLPASTASYGVYIAELASHLRAASKGTSTTVYWHNVAHDGSISRLLSILQVDIMVWPGLGSEVVFELYKLVTPSYGSYWAQVNGNKAAPPSSDQWYVRILWGGKVLRSSNPSIGIADMIPLSTLLAYFDGLVGAQAVLVPGLCNP